MTSVVFVVWDASKEEMKLINGIVKFFVSLFDTEIDTKIDDLKLHGETTYKEPCIIFGGQADNYANYTLGWMAPNLKMMSPGEPDYMEHKKRAMDVLKTAAGYLQEKKVEKPTRTYVETQDSTTVGLSGCDINITEQEAAHLKNIRDILGGGKMVITKGDLKIEVE